MGRHNQSDPMLHYISHRPATGKTRQHFYRVELAYNLFGEYSVLREWGPAGCRGHHLIVWFSNLRDACIATERWRKRAARRGYLHLSPRT